MFTVRLLSFVAGLIIAVLVFTRFRKGRARLVDFVLLSVFGWSLVTVSLFPDTVSLLRDLLSLDRSQFSRLIALIIVSNVALWLLLFYTRSHTSGYFDQFDRLVRGLAVEAFRAAHPRVTSLPPIAVIIPAYNEEDNIGEVLNQMPEAACGHQVAVIVVDDGSRDGTAERVEELGHLVVRSPLNRGGGAALRLGFDVAEVFGAEIIVTMDADGQHVPSELEGLVKPIVDGEFDIVIGSRVLGNRERDSLVRLAGIYAFSAVIRFLTAVRITDCSSGFRAFRRDELKRVLLLQDQFHTSELIIDAAKKGIRIGEVPITHKRRYSGESKKGRNLTYALAFARTIVRTWWR